MPFVFCDLNFIINAHQESNAYTQHLQQLAGAGTVTSCSPQCIGPKQPKTPTRYAVQPRPTSWILCWLAGFTNVGLFSEEKPRLRSLAFSKSRLYHKRSAASLMSLLI